MQELGYASDPAGDVEGDDAVNHRDPGARLRLVGGSTPTAG